jgi:hypothetical protein
VNELFPELNDRGLASAISAGTVAAAVNASKLSAIKAFFHIFELTSPKWCGIAFSIRSRAASVSKKCREGWAEDGLAGDKGRFRGGGRKPNSGRTDAERAGIGYACVERVQS